jgi:hypothetical protein
MGARLTRYWDKLACFGRTYGRGSQVFGLVFDAKGKGQLDHLPAEGASLADLRG